MPREPKEEEVGQAPPVVRAIGRLQPDCQKVRSSLPSQQRGGAASPSSGCTPAAAGEMPAGGGGASITSGGVSTAGGTASVAASNVGCCLGVKPGGRRGRRTVPRCANRSPKTPPRALHCGIRERGLEEPSALILGELRVLCLGPRRRVRHSDYLRIGFDDLRAAFVTGRRTRLKQLNCSSYSGLGRRRNSE